MKMKTPKQVTWLQLAKAMNEWERRYIEEPERFEHEITTLKEFNKAEKAGQEPNYGKSCADYLEYLVKQMFPGTSIFTVKSIKKLARKRKH
jgi:hypothetical protein